MPIASQKVRTNVCFHPEYIEQEPVYECLNQPLRILQADTLSHCAGREAEAREVTCLESEHLRVAEVASSEIQSLTPPLSPQSFLEPGEDVETLRSFG